MLFSGDFPSSENLSSDMISEMWNDYFIVRRNLSAKNRWLTFHEDCDCTHVKVRC